MDRSPPRVPYDPEEGAAPAELDAIAGELAGEGHRVLLAAAPDALEAGWPTRAALAIADAFVGRGRRVVLVDLDFEDPKLHTLLDLPNVEGIADVLLFGASTEHVALPAPGRDFDLIPGGAYVPDARAVLEHEGWDRVLGQLEAGGILLVAYGPASAPGIDALARRIGRVIVLGDDGGGGAAAEAAPVLAVVHPPAAAPAAAVAADEITLLPEFLEPDSVAAEPVEEVELVAEAAAAEPEAPGALALTEAEPEPEATRLTEPEPQASVGPEAPARAGPEAPPPAGAEAPPPAVPEAAAGSEAQVPVTPEPAAGAAAEPPARTPAPPVREPPARESFERVRMPRDSEREALIADLRARQRAALAYPPATPEPVVHPRPIVGGPGDAQAPAITEPPVGPIRIEPTPRRRRKPIVLTIVAVVLISLLAGLWHFGRGLLAARNAEPDAQDSVPVPAPVVGLTGEPAGEPLPYSVAIEAHEDLPTATRRIESLSRAAASTGFYIAPILVDSALYYRIMAGPVRDSAAAAAVMSSLIQNGHITGGSEWNIRATPYAFLLGEYELREQAEQRMAQLHQLDIPSYIIEVPYTNGPPRYYLYSGAYSGAAEADVMRQLLRSAGLADTLVERTGRSPT